MNSCDRLLLERNIIQKQELIEKFNKENNSIKMLNQLKSYPIDETRKENYINKHKDVGIRKTLRELINSITYINKDKFKNDVKEICDIYNNNKNDDIYVLLYIPADFVSLFDNGNIYVKSNFFTTLLATEFLKYDYILDITSLDEYKKINMYVNFISEKHPSKNIYLYICDDCSYSGTQLIELIDNLTYKLTGKTKFGINEKLRDRIEYNNKYKISIRLIIPYILKIYDNLIYIDQLKNLFKNDILENNFDNIEQYYNKIPIKNIKIMFSQCILIDFNLIKDKVYNNIKDIKKIEDIINVTQDENKKYEENYLLYFDFKIADYVSVNQIIMFGRVIIDKIANLETETDFKKNEVIKIKYYYYYPIIKDCDEYLITKQNEKKEQYECPDKTYKMLKYTFNNKEILLEKGKLLTHILKKNN